mgnify:CR=1 FL=1
MALQWNWKDKMGKLTIIRKMKKYDINIYSGNFLAVFVLLTSLYFFFLIVRPPPRSTLSPLVAASNGDKRQA